MTLEAIAKVFNEMLKSGADPKAEVRLAIQPTWPFAHYLGHIEEVEEPAENGGEPKTVVYISEAGQLGYLSPEACEQLNWR